MDYTAKRIERHVARVLASRPSAEVVERERAKLALILRSDLRRTAGASHPGPVARACADGLLALAHAPRDDGGWAPPRRARLAAGRRALLGLVLRGRGRGGDREGG